MNPLPPLAPAGIAVPDDAPCTARVDPAAGPSFAALIALASLALPEGGAPAATGEARDETPAESAGAPPANPLEAALAVLLPALPPGPSSPPHAAPSVPNDAARARALPGLQPDPPAPPVDGPALLLAAASAPPSGAVAGAAAETVTPPPFSTELPTGTARVAPAPAGLAAAAAPNLPPAALPATSTATAGAFRGVDAAAPAAAAAEPLPPLVALQAAVVPTPAPVAHASVVVAVETPAFVAGWHEETAAKVAGVVLRGHERADVRISPPDLGPVEVRIDVRAGEATLAIVAPHAATRDALEQSLPMLRELLAEQGLSLGETSVRDGREDAPPAPRRDSGSRALGQAATALPTDETAGPPRAHRLVDTFA